MLATPEMLADRDQAALARRAVGPGPFQDIPPTIWKLYLSAWAVLFGMFILFFAVNAAAGFAVMTAALFAVMAFGLPSTLAAVGRREGHQRGAVIQTHTGPLSIAAAGVQITLTPIGAVIGLSAFILLAMV